MADELKTGWSYGDAVPMPGYPPYGDTVLAPEYPPYGDAVPVPDPYGDAVPVPDPYGNAVPMPDPYGNAVPVPDPYGDAVPVPDPYGDAVPVPEDARLAQPGILRHGYGLIPKYAMQDRELSITAKAIYAYLCSLCGGGETAFPGVDTIRAALGLGKDAYYKHRGQLEEAGYITVTRRHRGKVFTSNLYLLNDRPKRFQREDGERADAGSRSASGGGSRSGADARSASDGGTWTDRIYTAVRLHGLRGAGYGILPRAVMTDPRLDAKAKALYAYFASFTGAGISAFPSQARMRRDLGVSQPAYYKYLNQLKQAGYLSTVQRKIGTRFAVNEYYLLDGTASACERQDGTAACERQSGTAAARERQDGTAACERQSGTAAARERQDGTAARERQSGTAACGRDELPTAVCRRSSPIAKNPDMIPYTKNPDMIKPDIIEPDTMDPDTTNNRLLTINKNLTNNKFSAIYPSIGTASEQAEEDGAGDGWDRSEKKRENKRNQEKNEGKKRENRKRRTCPAKAAGVAEGETEEQRKAAAEQRRQEKERYLAELKRSSGYEDLPVMYPGLDMGLVDNLLGLMVSAVCGGPAVRIAGREVRREEARTRFLSLTGEHLLYVLRCVREQGGAVRNLRSYYLAALWNAPETMELYYQQRVERDLRAEWENDR